MSSPSEATPPVQLTVETRFMQNYRVASPVNGGGEVFAVRNGAGQVQVFTRLPQIGPLEAKRQDRHDVSPPAGIRQYCIREQQRRGVVSWTFLDHSLQYGCGSCDRRPLPRI